MKTLYRIIIFTIGCIISYNSCNAMDYAYYTLNTIKRVATAAFSRPQRTARQVQRSIISRYLLKRTVPAFKNDYSYISSILSSLQEEEAIIKHDPIDKEARSIIQNFITTQGLSLQPHHIRDTDLNTQDRLCAFLLNKLMDETDTTSFKPIARCFDYCPKIQTQYPEFALLVEQHSEKPSPREFVSKLQAMQELPPQFKQTKETRAQEIRSLYVWQKLWVVKTIYGKFA